MENVWERFDSIVNPEDVMEQKAQFEPIKPGVYAVTVESLVSAENRNGFPMLKGKFRLVDSNRILFYNHNLQVPGYEQLTIDNVAEAYALVQGILQDDFDFRGLGDLANKIESIPVGTGITIEVSYGRNDTGMSFPSVKVVENEVDVDDIELDIEPSGVTDEDLPW